MLGNCSFRYTETYTWKKEEFVCSPLNSYHQSTGSNRINSCRKHSLYYWLPNYLTLSICLSHEQTLSMFLLGVMAILCHISHDVIAVGILPVIHFNRVKSRLGFIDFLLCDTSYEQPNIILLSLRKNLLRAPSSTSTPTRREWEIISVVNLEMSKSSRVNLK